MYLSRGCNDPLAGSQFLRLAMSTPLCLIRNAEINYSAKPKNIETIFVVKDKKSYIRSIQVHILLADSVNLTFSAANENASNKMQIKQYLFTIS